MSDYQVEIAVLKTRMDEFEKNINGRFDRLEEKMDAFMEKSEDRFAAKWTEVALKWAIGIICGMVLTAIVGLVINAGTNLTKPDEISTNQQ